MCLLRKSKKDQNENHCIAFGAPGAKYLSRHLDFPPNFALYTPSVELPQMFIKIRYSNYCLSCTTQFFVFF